jgi:3-hydroxyacyl-CoA dehydrogenase
VELTFLTPGVTKLFEIIPGPQTSSEVLDFLTIWREIFRKTSVVAKILVIGNRIVYGIKVCSTWLKKWD